MTEEHMQLFREFFDHYVVDQNAIDYLMDFIETINTWDDLYDQDKPVSREEINKSYTNLIHRIAVNPFYQSYMPQLQAMMTMLYLQWNAANNYEQEKISLEKAYMLRAGLYGLIHYVILLTQGFEKAQELSNVIYDFYSETFDDYVGEVLENA